MINIYQYFSKIYYINLNNDKNKKKYFESEIIKSELLTKQCKRYEAVFGENLDIRIIPNHIISTAAKKQIQSKTQKQYGISLTYGSAACALSHYLIYEECSADNKPYMIFEDDIIIQQSFDNNLNSLLNLFLSENLNDSYDIIYLGYNEIPISKPRGLITGLYGYILSNKGAKKILDNVFPLQQQIDSSISNNIEKFNLFCSSDKIVGVRTDFGSRTQSQASCKNRYGKILEIDKKWQKLFDV
jgi:GR25 family glycosyltransferase involved in LPS biosynthesis